MILKMQGGSKMALKTAEQYEESLRKMNLKVYLLGELVKNPG
jgi:4-hydroxybutyryl-CoA dehydratase/vinylacetyl-CoA-Delta-isomerase